MKRSTLTTRSVVCSLNQEKQGRERRETHYVDFAAALRKLIVSDAQKTIYRGETQTHPETLLGKSKITCHPSLFESEETAVAVS